MTIMNDRPAIDNAIKDKIIAEQVWINHLQQQYLDSKNEYMDLDTLDQEIANHPMKNAAPKSSKMNHIDRNTFIPEADDL